MKAPKITFVLIKNKQVESAETINAEQEAIYRRICKIQEEGFDSCVAVFGEGAKWDIRFPMSDIDIEKTSIKLERNL
jgi:hypothetical protein